MSSLIVEVCEIFEVRDHPNADRLDLVMVKGWQCCVTKGKYKKGDLIVYAPIDSVIPVGLGRAMAINNYLSNGRVKTVVLRGEYSQGLIIPLEFLPIGEYKVGDDVKNILGITKYEPPIKVVTNGVHLPDHQKFPIYTNIENIKNFPNLFVEGEEVVITEKIHGTNCRIGMIDGQFMVGSHRYVHKDMFEELGEQDKNVYWRVARNLDLKSIIQEGEIIYGEIYGMGVQKGFWYDRNDIQLCVFDVRINNKYLNYKEMENYCTTRNLSYVPVLYKGAWGRNLLNLARGKSSIASHIKEGIVIRPLVERYDYKIKRVILKHISEEYLVTKYPDTIPH